MAEKHLAVKSVKKYREANQCGEQDHQILNAVVISLMEGKREGSTVVSRAGWQRGNPFHHFGCVHFLQTPNFSSHRNIKYIK